MSEENQFQESLSQGNPGQNNAAQGIPPQGDPGQNNAAQGTPPQGDPVQMNAPQQRPPKSKKRKTGVWVAIACAAVLVIGIAGFAAGKIFRAVEKANMDPTEYYQYVVKKSREENLKDITRYYDASQKMAFGSQTSREVDLSVEISDTAKSLISLIGLDVTNIENLGLNVAYGTEGDDTAAGLALKVNDEDLLTGKASFNVKDNKAYAQFPELSPSYLDFSEALSDLQEQMKGAVSSLGKQKDLLPNANDLEDFIIRYSDVFIENAKGVEKKKETAIQVEDISEKATTYTFTMKNDIIIKLLEQCVKELQNDQLMKKMLSTADEQVYTSFVEELKKLQEQLSVTLSENAVGELKVTVEAHISSDDRIVAQKMTLENAGKELGSLSISSPKDGDKFGEEIVLQAQGKDLIQIVGSGTNDSKVINGEFKFGVDNSLLVGTNLVNTDELLIIKFEDYDFSEIAQGKFKGRTIYSTNAVAALANCSLVLEQEGSAEDMKQSVKFMTGKDTLVTVDIATRGNVELPVVKPTESDTVYNVKNNADMLVYQSELDIIGFLDKVKDKTGIDITSLLDLEGLGDEGYTDPGDIMSGDEGILWDLD